MNRSSPVAGALLSALVISLPFMDFEVGKVLGKSIVLPYVFVALLGCVVATRRDLRSKGIWKDSAVPFLIGWLGVAGLSAAWAFLRSQESHVLSSNAFQFANLAYMGAHYLVMVTVLQQHSRDDLLRVRDLFVLTACAGVLLSIYQLGSVFFGWPYTEWLRTSNLYYKANTLNWHGGGSWISFPRAYGPAPEPTFWASLVGLALCLAVSRIGERARWRTIAEISILAIGLLVTFSRAAVLPLTAAFAVWVVARWSVPRWIVPAVVASIIVATVLPAFVGEQRLALLTDLSALERVSAHITGLDMAADYPLLGVGPGTVPSVIDRYVRIVGGVSGIEFSRLYSFCLIVIVTTGALGLVLFALFLLEVGRRQHHVFVTAQCERVRSLALSSLMAYVFLLVYWTGSPAYNMSFLWFPLAFGSALASRVGE